MCTCTCVKVRVSMPEDLIDAVRDLVGANEFSQYVTEAVDRRHRHDLLGELIEVTERGRPRLRAGAAGSISFRM